MASIPRAFHLLEKKVMTVPEYEAYLKAHPYQSSLRAIKCIECGDILTYCNGKINAPYFKHSPTHEGHGYCSLYREGTESKTNEALIRKKLFQEEDISLNYELLYRYGKWKSLITIPPFKDSEIKQNEQNKTVITVGSSPKSVELPIDSYHFQPGQIRKVNIGNFYTRIHIAIKGNSTRQDISYDMDGFNPDIQMYSSLILQNFVHNDDTKEIDLRSINSFVCKRISGHVYTGRHYLIFSKNYNLSSKYTSSKSIEIKKVNLAVDSKFNYCIYDVVFTEVDCYSEKFCNNRNCDVVQKDDAVIIWPPIKTVGNYRYYPNRQTNMFISFQNESMATDIAKCETYNKRNGNMYLFFKVQNINSNSYYVTMDESGNISKKPALILNTNKLPQNADRFEKIYHLNDGVYLQSYDSEIKLKKKSGLLYLNNQLDKIFYQKEASVNFDEKKLLIAIRYSRQFVCFEDKYYQYLLKKHKDNQFVKKYLDHCNTVGTIKEKALEILLGETK